MSITVKPNEQDLMLDLVKEAQCGKKLTDEQVDYLVAEAQMIIDTL